MGEGSLHGMVANVLDCDIEERKFKPQLWYYVQFQTITLGKGMNPYIPPAMGEMVP